MPAKSSAPKSSVKAQAARLIRELPDSASWDDVMYHLFVREKIEAGLADIKKGRVHSHASIKKEFGLAS